MAMKSSSFASRLRELLSIRGLSQAELARRSGVSESSISRYLKGSWEAKQDAVYAIARVADVSEAWLMGYDVPLDSDSLSPPFDTSQVSSEIQIISSVSLNPQETELVQTFRALNPLGQEEALQYVHHLADRDIFKKEGSAPGSLPAAE